jgi:O-antigen/teichoic acid export membrane protein
VKKILKKIKEKFGDNEHFLEVLKGGIFSFGAKIVTLIIGLASTWIITKFYGAEILGILTLMNSIIGVMLVFSIAGLGTSLLRFIPEHIQKYSKYSAYLVYKKSIRVVVVFSFTISFLVYFFRDFIAINIFHKPELVWLFPVIAGLIIIMSVVGISTAVVQAHKNIKILIAITIIRSALFFIFLVVFTYFSYGERNPIYIQAFTEVILFFAILLIVYILFIKNMKIDDYQKVSNKMLLSVSLPMFVTGALNSVIMQTDIIMLGIIENSSQVGLYAMAMKLGMLSSFFLTAVNTLAAPKFSELYHSQRYDDLKIVAQSSSGVLFWTVLPLTICFIVFGKNILGFFGEEFVDAYWALVFLLIGQFINAFSGSVGYFLNMTGYQKIYNYVMLFSALLNIMLNVVLIPKFGITGAAFASMVSFISWNLIANIIIKNKYGFYIAYMPLFKKTS